MKAIDLTVQPDLHVRVDPSPAYDFLAALYLVRHWAPDRAFEVDPGWVAAARRALGREGMAEAALLLPVRSPVLGILALLEDAPGLPVRQFLARLRQTPAVALMEQMLGSARALRPVLPQLRRTLAGDRNALEAILAALPREYDPRALRRLLALRPAEVKRRLLRLGRAFYSTVYAAEEARVGPLLAADAAARQRLLKVTPPADVVERATGGFVLTREAGVASVLLAPTYFFRPYNLITEYHGVRVYIYPVEPPDARDTGARPPQDLVRLYKALADETRLRILRLLSEREMYVQEVARALGVSHVTAIHHLAQLRAAQLVQVVERDNLRYYRLRTDTALGAARRWRDYLKGRAAP